MVTRDGKQEKVMAGEPRQLKRLARLYVNRRTTRRRQQEGMGRAGSKLAKRVASSNPHHHSTFSK